MQNSELFRRGVVVPLDQDAEDKLRANSIDTPMNVRFFEILGEDAFADVWDSGVLDQINACCQVMLDDYEEDVIEVSQATGVLAAIEVVKGTRSDHKPSVIEFLDEVRSLAETAIALSRPIFFIL